MPESRSIASQGESSGDIPSPGITPIDESPHSLLSWMIHKNIFSLLEYPPGNICVRIHPEDISA